MSTYSDNGKGRRPIVGYNVQKFVDNYDAIFRKPKQAATEIGFSKDAEKIKAGLFYRTIFKKPKLIKNNENDQSSNTTSNQTPRSKPKH